MENRNRNWYRNHPEYNDRWDEHADRDRYERDYYQNRQFRPQGYSYNADRDMYGEADFNRYGTGYTGNDYDRYGDRRGHDTYRTYGGEADWNGTRYGSDYDRYNSGYSGRRERNATNYGYRDYPDYGSSYRDRYEERKRQQAPHDRNRDWWDRTSDEVASWFGDDEAEHRRNRDKRYENHSGKGPRDYKHSDEKLKSELDDELYHDSYIDASDMETRVKNGVVTLTGSVSSKWVKRRAEDLAETMTGVKEVENNLTVRKETGKPTDYYSNSESGNITTNTRHKTSETNQKVKS